MNETPPSREPPLDPEVVGSEQRAGKADSRHAVLQAIVASFTRSSGPVYHPIFHKFEADREERQLRRGDRRFRLGCVLTGVCIFVFLTWFLLPDHAALYLEILRALGISWAVVSGSYAFRAYRERSLNPPRDS